MSTFFLTQDSDPELDAMVLAASDQAQALGMKVVSARNHIHFPDPKIIIEAGTLLVTVVKCISDILKDKGTSMKPHDFAAFARESIKAECERRGIEDYHVDQLTILTIKGHKAISAVVECKQFTARVLVDDLGNVTFTQMSPTIERIE